LSGNITPRYLPSSLFYKDLGGDWLSFIEAAKAITELALDALTSLAAESAAIKSQFHRSATFLAIKANTRGFLSYKGSNDL
jgi:hypothetical protein